MTRANVSLNLKASESLRVNQSKNALTNDKASFRCKNKLAERVFILGDISLKHLKIKERLGGGSNGIVFRVELNVGKQDLKINLALKMILNYNRDSTAALKERFQNEYDILLNNIEWITQISSKCFMILLTIRMM